MSDSSVFDRTVQLMQDRLDLNALNHKVISSNLANINTPRYVAKSLSFDRVLKESLEEGAIALECSHFRHENPTDPVEALRSPAVEETGPVDLDHEMVRLSRNNIEYQFMVTMLNKKFALLKQAINAGGR
jgi:flagellar basal-body rod protein FlgB